MGWSPSRPRRGSRKTCPRTSAGRVFGVLGMLVSVASFLPIIIVGPISDLVGHDGGHLRLRDRGHGRRDRVRPDARPARARCQPGRRPARGRPDRLGLGGRPPDVDRPSSRPERRHDAGHRRGAPVPTPETVAETVLPVAPSRGIGSGRRRRSARARPGRPIRPDRPGLSPMGRVAVVFTGGTISTAFDPVAGGNVPDPRRRGHPGPNARAGRRGRRRGHRPRPDPGQPLHVPGPPRHRRRRALGARRSGDRWRGDRPGHGHDRGDRLLLGPRARRPEAGRGDRGDARVGRRRVRRAGQPSRRGPGRDLGSDARDRAWSSAWPARSSRPTT